MAKFSEMEIFIGQIKEAIATKPTYVDNGFDIDDVHQRIENYKKTVNQLLTTPSPPKGKEEKKQEPKE